MLCPTRKAPARVSIRVVSLALLVLGSQPLASRAEDSPDAARWLPAAAARLASDPAQLALAALATPAPDRDDATLDLALGGTPVRVVLHRVSRRSPGFRVLVADGGGSFAPVAVPPPATWRGTIAGEPGSRASAAIVDGEWRAIVDARTADGERSTWTVTPLRTLVPGAPRGLAVVARAGDVADVGGTCGVTGEAVPLALSPEAAERTMALWPQQVRRIELACDADSEFYALNGSSVATTVADIEAVINGAADLDERDLDATIAIGTVIVRTTDPDPYTSSAPSTLLSQLRTEWIANQSGIVRDAVQLFTGRDLDGTTIGIAYQSTLCLATTGYCLVQSRSSTVLANRVQNSAHELAHVIGAGHCDGYDYNCRIMCSSQGGCSGGVLSFGPSETTALRQYLAASPCLDTVTVDVPHAGLPFSDAFPGNAPDGNKWTAVDRGSVSSGRLALDHTKGFGTAIYLGTARTLPIVLVGRPTISWRMVSNYVPAGQQMRVEWFDSSRERWFTLVLVSSPGGAASTWIPYTYALGDTAVGAQFALRFTAYGNNGVAGAQWYVDDVAISSTVDAPHDLVSRTRLLPASPNPFARSTWLAFELNAAAAVRLEVHDLRGARVRTLLAGTVPGARWRGAWDGRDDQGHDVPCGVYFARLRSGSAMRTVRLVLLR